jgi:hypothetical protein
MHVYGSQEPANEPLVIESEKPAHQGNIYENAIGEGYSCSNPNPHIYLCYAFVDYKDDTRYIDIVYNEPVKGQADLRIHRRAGTLKCLDWLDRWEYDRENHAKNTVSAKRYMRP